MARTSTPTEERAITLLGSGATPEQVASACGVTVSRISQLLSDPEFTVAVADLRFHNLSQHNARDSHYDSLEDAALKKLEDLFPLMMRPMEVLKTIAVLNSAKRRGVSAPEQVTAQQTVVSIVMPTVIVNKFVTNVQNQVIQAGNQELLTIQSGALLKEAQTRQVAALTLENKSELSNSQLGTTSIARERQERIAATSSYSSANNQSPESRQYPPSSFIPVRS